MVRPDILEPLARKARLAREDRLARKARLAHKDLLDNPIHSVYNMRSSIGLILLHSV
jgi:hypothetical protein